MPSSVSEGSSSMKKTLMRFLKPRKMRHIRYNIISNLDILVQILFFSWKENMTSQGKISEQDSGKKDVQIFMEKKSRLPVQMNQIFTQNG